jgi:hypothetical protein
MSNIIPKFKFKKIYLLDLVFISTAVIVLFFFLSRHKSIETHSVDVLVMTGTTEWWELGKAMPYWLNNRLTVGDKSYNTFGERTAEVINYWSYDENDKDRTVTAHLRLLASVDPVTRAYSYQYQSLIIGKPIDIIIGNTELKGIISDVNIEKPELINKTVTINYKNVTKQVSEAVLPGLKILDGQGNITAEIIKADKIQTTTKTINLNDNTLNFIGSPSDNVDLLVKIKLSVEKKDNSFYFIYGDPLKVGSKIKLRFPQVILPPGEVINIE